ncbi:MAG: alpha/beta hydrolase, partial [Nannocystaceae bacterium]
RLLWAAYRLSPRLAEFFGKRYMTQMRRHRLDGALPVHRLDRARLRAGDPQRLRASLATIAERRGVEPWFDRFTHSSVRANDGTKLALEMITEAGRGRPTVVFMPGTNAYSLLYGEFLLALADAGLNVVGFDPRGHGRSEGQGGSYTLPELVDDFAVVVEHARARMGGPIFAAGSSQGGIAAFYLAASEVEIAGAVCHNAADLSDPSSARLTRFPRLGRLFKPALLGLAKILPEVRVPMRAYLDLKKEPVRGMGTAHEVLHQDPLLVPYVRLKTLASLGSAPLARPVEAIETPLLLLQAGADTIFPTDYMTTLFERLTCPKQMHVYPGLPHYLVVDHVETLAADVVRWIGETCA